MKKNDVILANEEQNRKKGLLMSIVLHLLLIFLCFMTFFNDHKKPTDQISGIIVQLGLIEGGNSVEEALSEATPSESLENVLAAAAAPIASASSMMFARSCSRSKCAADCGPPANFV